MTKFFSKWGDTNLEMEGNLTPMIWAAQLLVAVFFIAGFVSFYTEIWNGLKSIFETDFKRHSEPRLPSTAQINH